MQEAKVAEKGSRASVTGKILLEGTLTLDAPLLIGTGLTSSEAKHEADTQILKDKYERPFIPGTSLAGVLRSLLSEETAALLFGSVERGSRTGGAQSAVDVEDVLLEDAAVVMRDGVGIADFARTSIQGRKYNYEAVERGAKGALRMTVTLRRAHEGKELPEAVQALADRLAAGVRIGALTAKGFGKVSASDIRVAFYDFSDFDDVRRWLLRDAAKNISHGSKEAGRQRAGVFAVDASFAIRRSLIVRENDVEEAAAEKKIKAQQKKSGQDFLIPGTSLKGVLRHRAVEILTILKKPPALLDRLMGCRRDASGQKSRFLVDEVYFKKGVVPKAHARNRLDAFTGGTVDSVLFTDEPVWQQKKGEATLKLHYEIEDYAPWEAGLALYLLRDLWQGNIPLGGESSVGRGILEGVSATVSLGEESYTIGARGALTEEAAARLEAFAEALRDIEEEAKEA